MSPTRTFSLLDITSGLPDYCREEDERREERRLRELRGRVKHARAIVSGTPGVAEVMGKDWRKAARFYAQYGIMDSMFRYGVPANERSDRQELVGPAPTDLRDRPERISVVKPVAA